MKGENVKFDSREFIRRLVSKPANVAAPKAGVMLKYFADTGEFCSIGTEDEDDSGESYTRWLMMGVLAVLIAVGCLMWYFMRGDEPLKPQEQLSKSQDVQSSPQGNSSPASPDVTSKDLKEAQKHGGHNSVNRTSNEMNFAVLGSSGAGKTTLLACMAEEFERVSPGTIFPAESFTFSTLSNAYKSLRRDANNSDSRQFERSIEGTSMLREFFFHVKGHRAYLPVRFYDFPGG